DGKLRLIVEPGYDTGGALLAEWDTTGHLFLTGSLSSPESLFLSGSVVSQGNVSLKGFISSTEGSHQSGQGLNIVQEIDFVKPDGTWINGMWIGLLDWGDDNRWLHLGGCSQNSDNIRRVWIGGTTHIEGDLFVKGMSNVYIADYSAWYSLSYHGGDNKVWWGDPSGGGTGSVSDLRLKSEVQPVLSALDKIRRLCGVTFRWNEDAMQLFTRDIETNLSAGPNATETENRKVRQMACDKRRNQLATSYLGVIAQDVEAVLPEAVRTNADGYKTVRYDNLIPLLIEAIKEQDQLAALQQVEIERLKLAVGIDESPTCPSA
ncbi:MAG: hypothetical protein JWN14_129, partial [Chthonomonadales bacterium]|nr:hypothetical protein [Chthonomonadales bacterium]